MNIIYENIRFNVFKIDKSNGVYTVYILALFLLVFNWKCKISGKCKKMARISLLRDQKKLPLYMV